MKIVAWVLMLILSSFTRAHAVDIINLGGDMTSPFQDRNALQLPAPNVTDPARRDTQLSGFAIFHGTILKEQGLGPKFNHDSCGGCHVNNGRGTVSLSPTSRRTTMIVKTSLHGLNVDGAPRDVPGVGEQFQDHRINGKNLYNLSLTWEFLRRYYPNGEKYSLRRPVLGFRVTGFERREIATSLRMTPPVIGPGLLEAIPEETILAMSDPNDADGDGISGRPQYVPNRRTGTLALGRFGFRASHPTVEQQSAAAAFFDMGVTNPLFFDRSDSLELSEEQLDRLDVYLRLGGVPTARDQNNPTVIRGKTLFQEIGCAKCHTMTLVTGNSDLPELVGQTIHPFTDLLLHDMGPGLADKRPEYEASGREWRTTPLWGLGFSETLSEVRPRFLHDGRARSIREAILWHGGEAAPSRRAFKSLAKSDRDALIAFLRSL